MALGAIAAYAPERTFTAVGVVVVIFVLINFPVVGIWALAGQALGRWLADDRRLRLFNLAMAFLLLASLVPVILG